MASDDIMFPLIPKDEVSDGVKLVALALPGTRACGQERLLGLRVAPSSSRDWSVFIAPMQVPCVKVVHGGGEAKGNPVRAARSLHLWRRLLLVTWVLRPWKVLLLGALSIAEALIVAQGGCWV